MHSLRRRLTTVLIWFAAIVGMVLAAVCLDSHWHDAGVILERIHYTPDLLSNGWGWYADSSHGCLMLSTQRIGPFEPGTVINVTRKPPSAAQIQAIHAASGYRWYAFQNRANVDAGPDSFFGFRYEYYNYPERQRRSVSFPMLPFVLLLLLPAGLRMNRWHKARVAARIGLCRRCGYDLRASPERCPECGTPIPPVIPPGAPLWLRTIRHSRARLYGCTAIAAVSLYLAYCAIYELVRLHVLYAVSYNYCDKGLAIAEQGCRGAFWLTLGATALLFSVNAALSRFMRRASAPVPAPAATH